MKENTNMIIASGKLKCLKLSHKVYGEAFYTFYLECGRLSENTDLLPVTVSERLLFEHTLCEGSFIRVSGQLRSYNKLSDGKMKLCLTIFARDITESPGLCNEISLTGYICKPPVYRITPFGREITDILLASNRAYNKSDYIPCIVWGRNARYASSLCVGDRVSLLGRFQSRLYEKCWTAARKKNVLPTRFPYHKSKKTKTRAASSLILKLET